MSMIGDRREVSFERDEEEERRMEARIQMRKSQASLARFHLPGAPIVLSPDTPRHSLDDEDSEETAGGREEQRKGARADTAAAIEMTLFPAAAASPTRSLYTSPRRPSLPDDSTLSQKLKAMPADFREHTTSRRLSRFIHRTEPLHMVRFNPSGNWRFKYLTFEALHHKYRKCCRRILSQATEKRPPQATASEGSKLRQSASRMLPPHHIFMGVESRSNFNLLPGGLSFKDLQRLDPRSGLSESCILVKSFAFLIAMGEIRALVLPTKLYLVVVDGMDGELDILRRCFARALAPDSDDEDHLVIKSDASQSQTTAGIGTDIAIEAPRERGRETARGEAAADSTLTVDLEAGGFRKWDHYDRGRDHCSTSSSLCAADDQIPFELIVLTSILETVVGINPGEQSEDGGPNSILTKELEVLRQQAEKKAKKKGLEDLRLACLQGSRFSRKVGSLKGILKDVLDNDASMALMNLSKVARDPQLYLEEPEEKWKWDHQEIEHILTYYLQCLERVRAQTKSLNSELKAERNDYTLRLDSARNRLLRMQIYFLVITAFAALAAVPAGIGGMSELDSLSFTTVYWIVSGLLLGLPVIFSILVLAIAEYREWMITA